MGAGKTVKAETCSAAATSERNDRRAIVDYGLSTMTPRRSPHKTPSTSCGLQRCLVSPHRSGERRLEIGRVRDTGEQPPHHRRTPEGRWAREGAFTSSIAWHYARRCSTAPDFVRLEALLALSDHESHALALG